MKGAFDVISFAAAPSSSSSAPRIVVAPAPAPPASSSSSRTLLLVGGLAAVAAAFAYVLRSEERPRVYVAGMTPELELEQLEQLEHPCGCSHPHTIDTTGYAI